MRMIPAPLPLLLPLLSLAVPVAAQDDVLTVERRQDLLGRDAVVRLLQAARSDFRFEELAPRDVCRLFAARLDDKLSFSLAAPAADLGDTRISLDLKQQSLWTAMSVVQLQTGLRFVYRSGVVFLVPADALEPLTFVRVYDLRPQTAPLRNFPGPELRLPGNGDDRPLYPEEEEPTTTVSGFTADGIEQLLREHVLPESWGTGAASLTNTNGLFVVRQTPQGHREVVALLVELGLWARPRVLVRRPAPPPLPRAVR